VARRILIGRQFTKAVEKLGILEASDEGRAIARSVRALSESDELPFPRSADVLMPPCVRAWLYPVPRTQLSLLYVFDDQTFTAISVRRTSPDVLKGLPSSHWGKV
jgi:hypothetical protein